MLPIHHCPGRPLSEERVVNRLLVAHNVIAEWKQFDVAHDGDVVDVGVGGEQDFALRIQLISNYKCLLGKLQEIAKFYQIE